jgi:hypothetical protein
MSSQYRCHCFNLLVGNFYASATTLAGKPVTFYALFNSCWCDFALIFTGFAES